MTRYIVWRWSNGCWNESPVDFADLRIAREVCRVLFKKFDCLTIAAEAGSDPNTCGVRCETREEATAFAAGYNADRM